MTLYLEQRKRLEVRPNCPKNLCSQFFRGKKTGLPTGSNSFFRFFEKNSDRFFEVGHFCKNINVQNLRGPSEILGKTKWLGKTDFAIHRIQMSRNMLLIIYNER